jgi:hypothetical protein
MDNKMRMKLTLGLLIVLLNSILLNGQVDLNCPLKIDFKIAGVSCCDHNNDLNSKRMNKPYINMYGILKLENQSNSVFSFWIMKCSWTDLIKVEPDSILLYVKACDSNYPVKISLESHQSILFNSIIEIPSKIFEKSEISRYSDHKFKTFKIGFLIISEKEFDFSHAFGWQTLVYNKKKKNDFIWTPPINIVYHEYGWEILK